MRAKFIRGQDPLDSLNIGDVEGRKFARAKEEIKKAMNKLVDRFGGKFKVYIDRVKNSIGKGMWTPPKGEFKYAIDCFIAMDGEMYFTPEKYNKKNGDWTGSYGGQKTAIKALDYIINIYQEVYENLKFIRGKEPKEALGIGKNRNNFFATLESIPYKEYLKSGGEDIRPENLKLLKTASKLLKAPEEKVRIASKNGKNLSYKEIEKIIDSREWNYNGEAYTKEYNLIKSSTEEIYVQYRNTEDILYILGTIY